jgi:4-amino-4-deoxy-L-arabinose transferase-like glycosyltransferase
MGTTEAATGRAVTPGLLLPLRRPGAWVPWALGTAIAVGAVLRVATLGMQSYHHDEAWTAGIVLHSNLSTTMHKVYATESTPPLYYLLAWGWSKLFGSGEWGLRSLSALFGVATIPVAYLIGRRLAGATAAPIAAALAAVNPALIWYSQEARAYALLILLSALAFLFFLRAREGFAPRDLAWWAVLSALATATHYFGAMPTAVEAALLLAGAGTHRRAALVAVVAVLVAALALAPLALHQADAGHADWIARLSMATRLKEAGAMFVNGETGRFISQPLRWRYALIPLLLAAGALGLLAWRGSASEQRAAGLGLLVAGGSLLLALLAAVAGRDFVLGRNLLPALIPLLTVVAIGIACNRAGRLGLAVGAALLAYWLVFAVYVDLRPRLQRPDWRDIAADIGPVAGPREIVTGGQGAQPLRYYLSNDATEIHSPRPPLAIREVDVVSVGVPPPRHGTGLPPAFHPAGQLSDDTVTLTRYAAPRPVPVPWRELLDHYTGFFSRDVLAQGVRAPQPAG